MLLQLVNVQLLATGSLYKHPYRSCYSEAKEYYRKVIMYGCLTVWGYAIDIFPIAVHSPSGLYCSWFHCSVAAWS